MNPNTWLEKHEHLLPQMSDGERVNYDPITYFPPTELWRLKALELHRQREALNKLTDGDERKRGMIYALFVKTLVAIPKMTGLQLVSLYGLINGNTQEQIANAAGTDQPHVARSQERALKLLCTANGHNG